MLFLTKYESNLVTASPSITMGDLIWKFVWWQKFFLHLWQDKPLSVELKIYGGVIFITVLLDFHYFIYLEIANTQKSEAFLLRTSSGNVNVSVATCQYLKVYNFNFVKEFLETLCKCIYLEF